MKEEEKEELERRVAALEAEVARIRRDLETPAEERSSSVYPKRPAQSAPPVAKLAGGFDDIRRSEFWLNKIGIGLLLLGLAFLFKYSIDQGWLTPAVRIAFGLALGVALLLTGYRVSSSRRHFSQVLAGGAVASFYITGFAAFQLYALVSHGLAFGFMVLTTLLSFWIALRYEARVLAIIATIGGLATPFLLYTGRGNVPGLVMYLCLLLSAALGVFYLRGWTWLLRVTVVGGWTVLLFATDGLKAAAHRPGGAPISDYWWLESAFLFCWLAFWGVPLWRQLGRTTDRIGYVYALVVLSPFITIGFSELIWDLSQRSWGWIILGGAVLYAFVSLWLKHKGQKALAWTHFVTAMALLTLSLWSLLEGETLLLALAAEAMALHLANSRVNSHVLEAGGHVLFVICGLWLLAHMTEGVGGADVTPVRALTDLTVLGAAVLSSWYLPRALPRVSYLSLAHLFFLAWLYCRLHLLAQGQAWITVTWGVYGAALLLAGLLLNRRLLRFAALSTLATVVAKLFLVDLDRLDPLWRVVLFLGFGGAFLLLSYYTQSFWRSPEKAHPESWRKS